MTAAPARTSSGAAGSKASTACDASSRKLTTRAVKKPLAGNENSPRRETEIESSLTLRPWARELSEDRNATSSVSSSG